MRPRSTVRDDSGAVAIWVGATLAVLIGIVGLSIDLGRASTADTELKWAADAAALAGARQLDGTAGARARATAAAMGAAGVGLTSNKDSFDDDDAAVEVASVKFLSKLGPGEGPAGDIEATTDENARYIQVVVEQTVINNVLIQIIGGESTTPVQRSSVAGYGSTICRIPPLMFCNPDETPTNKEVNLTPGMGVLMKDGGGNKSQWGPGNYGLLEIPGLPGADAIRDSLASLHGSPVCFDPSLVTTEPGNPVSVNAGINVRLDMFSGSTNSLKNNATTYPAKNIVKGLGYGQPEDPSATKCKPSTGGYDLYTGEGDAAEIMPYPRDKCFYAGTCTRFGDGQWDKAAYCTTTHGDATCSTVEAWATANGKDISTRYGLYRAEVESGLVPNQVEDVKSLCYQRKTWDELPKGTDVRPEGFVVGADGPDRRVLVTAIVNCQQQKELGNLNGKKSVEVAEWALMFLTEAAGEYGDNQQIFLEYIRSIEMENDETYAHEIVQLYR
jgi:Flp pilus assembly protein TadG